MLESWMDQTLPVPIRTHALEQRTYRVHEHAMPRVLDEEVNGTVAGTKQIGNCRCDEHRYWCDTYRHWCDRYRYWCDKYRHKHL